MSILVLYAVRVRFGMEVSKVRFDIVNTPRPKNSGSGEAAAMVWRLRRKWNDTTLLEVIPPIDLAIFLMHRKQLIDRVQHIAASCGRWHA